MIDASLLVAAGAVVVASLALVWALAHRRRVVRAIHAPRGVFVVPAVEMPPPPRRLALGSMGFPQAEPPADSAHRHLRPSHARR